MKVTKTISLAEYERAARLFELAQAHNLQHDLIRAEIDRMLGDENVADELYRSDPDFSRGLDEAGIEIDWEDETANDD